MATNDFKPFATGAGANVIDQADYQALAELSSGFTAGKASSVQMNKVLRQATIFSSVLAQFISNQLSADVLDNGDTATLLNNLIAALYSNSAAGFFVKNNNLAEISAAGPVAQSAAIASLGLNDAVRMGGLTGVVGTTCNANMNVSAASTTAILTADEIIVETAVGNIQYRLNVFNKTVNLAITGVGGMDTGTVPATGFVALYAIYNPSTSTSALLAVNATSAIATEIYSGTHIPSGYTASALLTVVPISASKFSIFYAHGRDIYIVPMNIYSSATGTSGATISITGACPLNAISFNGNIQYGSTTAGTISVSMAPRSSPVVGSWTYTAYSPAATSVSSSFYGIPIITEGSTIISTSNATGGAATYLITCSGYSI
jgi:hypothetical protein